MCSVERFTFHCACCFTIIWCVLCASTLLRAPLSHREGTVQEFSCVLGVFGTKVVYLRACVLELEPVTTGSLFDIHLCSRSSFYSHIWVKTPSYPYSVGCACDLGAAASSSPFACRRTSVPQALTSDLRSSSSDEKTVKLDPC